MNSRFFYEVQNSIVSWYRLHGRIFPWRENNNPYNVLIAELLLRRTTSKAVSRVYPLFIKRYPNILSLAGAQKRVIEKIIKPLGLYKIRTNCLLETAKFIEYMHNGRIPRTKASLLRVPNIGQYIAAAVLTIAFRKRSLMIDSNIQRLIKRIFKNSLNDDNRSSIYAILGNLVPYQKYYEFNLGLLDIASTICLPKNPKCSSCPIKLYCEYYTALKNL